MPVIWELDFYSRPVVDEQKKKLWEVLICESPLEINQRVDSLFRFSKFCANTEVNSLWLRQALEEAIAQAPKPPDKVRFFRRQMSNMILKAVQDVGIAVNASRRTLALHQWIEQRMAEEYPKYPNYQAGANPSVAMSTVPPKPLPDALIGQQWAFVTLEASAFADMSEWAIDFSEAFPLDMVGIEEGDRIPGVIIFSPRAIPLAAWISGLELASLRVKENKPAQILLETGASDSWILANLANSQILTEAKNFEAAKKQAKNVHFLAVQSDPDADSFAGFWLMQELNLA